MDQREVQNNIRLCGVDFNKLYAKVSPTEFNKILSILNKVFVSYECDGRNLSYFEMNYIYYQIMNILDNGIHKKMSLQSDSKNINHVDEALIYFSNHYTDLDFSITKVSKAIGIHKNYLSKLFKEQTGLTFNNYLLNRRMNLAVYYIRQGYTSVSEIASKVGFDDQFYFSKVFKKYNHITPTEEIKKHKKN